MVSLPLLLMDMFNVPNVIKLIKIVMNAYRQIQHHRQIQKLDAKNVKLDINCLLAQQAIVKVNAVL